MHRGAATYWVKSTGHLPPGMKSLDELDQERRSAEEAGVPSREPVLADPAPIRVTEKVSQAQSRQMSTPPFSDASWLR